MASLFKKAKESAPDKKTSAKAQKVRVTVTEPGFFDKIKRQAFLVQQIKSFTAESDLIADEIKETGKAEWAKLYEKNGVNPESIMIESKHNNDTAQYMFLVSDKYIIINQERADMLTEQYGEGIVQTKETYQFDNEMVEKYGEVISNLIENSSEISEADKEKIIKAVVTLSIAKGTVDKLDTYAKANNITVADMIDVVKPVISTKNVEYIEATALREY